MVLSHINDFCGVVNSKNINTTLLVRKYVFKYVTLAIVLFKGNEINKRL